MSPYHVNLTHNARLVEVNRRALPHIWCEGSNAHHRASARSTNRRPLFAPTKTAPQLPQVRRHRLDRSRQPRHFLRADRKHDLSIDIEVMMSDSAAEDRRR